MKSKINARLILLAVLAVLISSLSITFIYYELFESQVRSDLVLNAQLLKDTGYFDNKENNTIQLSDNLEDLRITWIDQDGTVLYDNDASASELENHLNRPEIQEAIQNGSGESIRQSKTLNEETIYYAIELENKTILRVATNTQTIWSMFLSVLPTILLIILIIIVLCIVISNYLTKQLMDPINEMAQNLENMDYSVPYKELEPFENKIRSQHNEVLSAAKARQDFTANVSHELKTPLTAISGYAQLLETDTVDKDQQHHFYKEIQKNADRLLSLINDIIRLSQLDHISNKTGFEEIDLYKVVEECMEDLNISAKQREIHLTLKGESCILNANKAMMKELVENLVSNAIRYNNPNGNVVITVNKLDRPTLIVEDDGIGISKEDQEHVFERFYRVDKSRSKATGGTGLGLAIVKHIVEIHDGTIELKSTLHQGTKITVTF